MLDAEAVLVDAALQGHPQIRGVFHSEKGDCALGVLHLAIPGHTRVDVCADMFALLKTHYGLRPSTCQEIARKNDIARWDFLTIARKLLSSHETDPS